MGQEETRADFIRQRLLEAETPEGGKRFRGEFLEEAPVLDEQKE
jgi:hypothetical protein